MVGEAIIKITNKEDLSYSEAYAVINEIISGESSQVQDAAFLATMSIENAKAETTDEIPGCTAAICARVMKVEYDRPTLEIIGTGGDDTKTFNISSISALVAVVVGIRVTKHGNRVTPSDCGSVDSLEAPGISINQDPELCKRLLDEINICFLLAQHYHASMKYVGAIRRELGSRTVFNILGPLANPASLQYFVLGVCDECLVWPPANVPKHLGVGRALVVYGQDKVDKISVSAPSTVCELHDDSFHPAIIKPGDFGLQCGKKEELIGGNPAENVQVAREILSGEKWGTRRTAVLLDTGAVLCIGGKTESLREGVQLAGRLVGEGKVLETYEKYIRLSNETAK